MFRILPVLRVLLFPVLGVCLMAAGGCGLKGDLVLPDPAGEPSAARGDETIDDAPGNSDSDGD